MKNQNEEKSIAITPPNIKILMVHIVGEAPLVLARFSKKAELMAKMKEGSSARNKKHRVARDYDNEAKEAKHFSTEGWEGISTACFRIACIDACRLVNYKMTNAKMSVFFEPDGYSQDNIPLTKIYGDGSVTYTAHTRNATGVVDIRSRPLYAQWGCILRVRYDADQFSSESIVNLVSRAGMQCGVGEGRPFSKDSAGQGFGIFKVVTEEDFREKLKVV